MVLRRDEGGVRNRGVRFERRTFLKGTAPGVFTTGQMGDSLVREGKIDLLAKTVEYI